MRLTPSLSLVASGRSGFMLTDALDCNVYLVDTGDGLLLIDSGAGRDVTALLAQVRADGYDPAAIRHVLLTHGHADHAGGSAELRQRLGAKVWASAEAGCFVREADEAAISLPEARAAVIYPPGYRFEPCPVDGLAEDRVPLTFGALEIVPLATPGHADGHLAYLMRDGERLCLFSGDLLLCGGQVLLQYTYDCSLQRLGASLLRLADLRIDALLPGHFHFCLSDGQAHIAAAVASLRRLLIPRSIA
jgi:glyoxylase-like metal-dependent hydrolase (beta-lactamase superfamily II)